MFSPFAKRFFLPILAALASFILFRLALHNPVDARAFSSLGIPNILAANECEGVYTHLFARLVNSIFNDPELSFRILTSLATGFSVYFIQKLFPSVEKWSAGYVIANISFLYFAMHSPQAMLTVMMFATYLAAWESTKPTHLRMAGSIAGLMLGFDSLLALALIGYTLVRVLGSKESPKDKVVSIAAIIIASLAWVLLAYMLYASTGISTALSASLDHLFEQVNPINFGVGLVVTFNLLLAWVFKSPTEKTNTKYLGSLLIVLFLFVKAEPVHLLLLLILGTVYLSKTGGLPKHRMIQPAYALLNIAAFFVLPTVRPLEAAYNVRAAKESEARIYYSSYFAKHLPSYRALVQKSKMLESTTDYFVRHRDTHPVILDPALEIAYDRSALRSMSTDRPIGGFDMGQRRFLTTFNEDTSMMRMAEGSQLLYYLATDARPAAMNSLLPKPLRMTSGLSVFVIDSTRYSQFFDAYIYHHYLSFH